MLKLKNVSKFYYTKDSVSSGFTKVNLELNLGEFVAITGESGSGKSTLLHVLSGLDTYEEGEMYLQGKETSNYTELEFENYRRKYIGNIFQNFNLVHSYTVYQNIELTLLINGFKKKEVKSKILEVLKQVGLEKYRNTKVSKLSGGQKQRVAIARALVKDPPILVADEPTGNLDTQSASEIIELLSTIAKDKLVIIVTHNYEQVENYVTRKITMHDGRIVEDKKLKEIPNPISETEIKFSSYRPMRITSKLRLGIRNTFNIFPKFLLLLFVYLFIGTVVLGGYSSLKKQEKENSNYGYNNYFRDTNDKRLILKKLDGSEITSEDIAAIKQLPNIDYVVANDLIIDKFFMLNSERTNLMGQAVDLSNFSGTVDVGRLPEQENEVLFMVTKNSYYLTQTETMLQSEFSLRNTETMGEPIQEGIKIVGISYIPETRYGMSTKIGMPSSLLDTVNRSMNTVYGTMEITLNNRKFQSSPYSSQYRVVPNAQIPQGKAYVPEEMNAYGKKNRCINLPLQIHLTSLYYEDDITVKIAKTFNTKTFTKLLKLENYQTYAQTFFISPEDYNSLYAKGNYQTSVFMKDDKLVQETKSQLQEQNYKVLYIKDTLVNYDRESNVYGKAVILVVTVVIALGLFFLTYFIIKIILKSRNIYFSTIRMLGATKKNAKSLLKIELLTILHFAYVTLVGAIEVIKWKEIQIPFATELIGYIQNTDLLMLYVIFLIVSLLIAKRYARQLFKKSAMDTFREEV